MEGTNVATSVPSHTARQPAPTTQRIESPASATAWSTTGATSSGITSQATRTGHAE